MESHQHYIYLYEETVGEKGYRIQIWCSYVNSCREIALFRYFEEARKYALDLAANMNINFKMSCNLQGDVNGKKGKEEKKTQGK